MKKKKAPKNGSLPPLPTELWWGRSKDKPSSRLIQERSWPKVVSYKLTQGEGHPPGGQPWYHTAPERLFDRIETETLFLWLRLAPRVLEAAHREDNNLATDPWRILAAAGRFIARTDPYHSVTVILEETSRCTSEDVLALRAQARDYQKIFHRIENLRLALALHNDAVSRLSESPTDLGECERKMIEALAWLVVEGYNLGSMARLAALRPLEEGMLQAREHKRIGGNKSKVRRRDSSAPARERALALAKKYEGRGSNIASLVTKDLAFEGFTHLYGGMQVPYGVRHVRGWIKAGVEKRK